MTLKEAKKMLAENEHLIGKKIGRETVEELHIVPKNGDHLAIIMSNSLRGIDSDYILALHKEFEVYVVFEPLTGFGSRHHVLLSTVL